MKLRIDRKKITIKARGYLTTVTTPLSHLPFSKLENLFRPRANPPLSLSLCYKRKPFSQSVSSSLYLTISLLRDIFYTPFLPRAFCSSRQFAHTRFTPTIHPLNHCRFRCSFILTKEQENRRNKKEANRRGANCTCDYNANELVAVLFFFFLCYREKIIRNPIEVLSLFLSPLAAVLFSSASWPPFNLSLIRTHAYIHTRLSNKLIVF